MQNKINDDHPFSKAPRFPSDIYDGLPPFLQKVVSHFEDPIQSDMVLINSIATISAGLPKILGRYFQNRISPHMYLFTSAKASDGKSALNWAKQLSLSIHLQKRKEYDEELETIKHIENQVHPVPKLHLVPANSSSTAIISTLSNNNNNGLIFETEADTLSFNLKQDWGNFSDILRKAFHHEGISYSRKKENELVELYDPHLAVVLSGTPGQIPDLFPSTENGLFSRFQFFVFSSATKFKNPFIISKHNIQIENSFEGYAEDLLRIYNKLNTRTSEIHIQLTEKQATDFTSRFDRLQEERIEILGEDFIASIRRLALTTFRIAMILTVLRIENVDTIDSDIVTCSETDFNTSMALGLTLIEHTQIVYEQLNSIKNHTIQKYTPHYKEFYNALDNSFDRSQYLIVAKKLNIKPKSAEYMIAKFKTNGILNHSHNKYSKPVVKL